MIVSRSNQSSPPPAGGPAGIKRKPSLPPPSCSAAAAVVTVAREKEGEGEIGSRPVSGDARSVYPGVGGDGADLGRIDGKSAVVLGSRAAGDQNLKNWRASSVGHDEN